MLDDAVVAMLPLWQHERVADGGGEAEWESCLSRRLGNEWCCWVTVLQEQLQRWWWKDDAHQPELTALQASTGTWVTARKQGTRHICMPPSVVACLDTADK